MTEIKSTLELALERTRKMSISEEEKEEIKRKEIVQKATGMFHRYLDDHVSLNEILREIERIEDKAGAAIRETLLSQWIDAVSLDERSEKLLRGIGFLKGRSIGTVEKSLESLRSEYERERQETEQRIRTRLEDALREEEIFGSAIVPHVKGSEEWRETIRTIEQSYREKIEEVKEALRKL